MSYKNPQSPELVARRKRLSDAAYRRNDRRQCSKCRKFYHLIDSETGLLNFCRHSVAADGIRPYCRFCERSYDNRKRVLRKTKLRINRKKRRAPLKLPCQILATKKDFMTFNDIRRYFGFSRSTMYALLAWRFTQVIHKTLWFPRPLAHVRSGIWCRYAKTLWSTKYVLRWERERFLPNAAIFFAHIRNWATSETQLADRKDDYNRYVRTKRRLRSNLIRLVMQKVNLFRRSIGVPDLPNVGSLWKSSCRSESSLRSKESQFFDSLRSPSDDGPSLPFGKARRLD